jgi:hypothetical protein
LRQTSVEKRLSSAIKTRVMRLYMVNYEAF